MSPFRSALPPVLAGLALTALPTAALAHGSGAPPVKERLVVRGDATVVDGPCDARTCRLAVTGGQIRGTLGPSRYDAALRLRISEITPNGEDGACAPLDGRVVLGAGTPDRLVLLLAGDSCQDGAGPLETASFTGLARFTVARGTGRLAGARGAGLVTLAEDAANRQRMTLVGRIAH